MIHTTYINKHDPYVVYVVQLDFAVVKSKYAEIIQLLPKNFEQTLERLQVHLSDDQICSALSCSSSYASNKLILDYLIHKMKRKEDLLDLYDQLDRLTDVSPNLTQLLNELRKGY